MPTSRSFLRLTAAIPLALSACGGEVKAPGSEPAWQSGDRLRARVEDGGDGATRFLGWHDRDLRLDCSFMLAEDGEQRCLPATSSSIEYEDAACERPIQIHYRCSSRSEWYSYPVPTDARPECTSVPTRYSVFRATGESSTTSIYTLDEGACQFSRPRASDEIVESLAPASVSEFVRGDERTRRASAGLDSRVLEGDDGSSTVIGFLDTERDEACVVSGSYGDSRRCVPSYDPNTAWITSYFSDAACTERLAYAQPCSRPEFAFVSFREGCTFRETGVHAIGEPFEGSVYQSYSAGQCDFQDAGWRDTHAAFSYGADITAEFPAADDIETGEGRLRVRRFAAGKATLAEGGAFFDTSSGQVCEPSELGGTIRCVPPAGGTDGQFADPNCSEPLVSWYGGDAACKREQPAFASRAEPLDCTTEYSYLGLGVEWTGEVYALNESTGCEAVVREPGWAYNFAGATVDPAMFPALTHRID